MKYITVMMVIVIAGFAILTSLMTAFMRSYSDNFRETADYKQATVQTVSAAMSAYVKENYEKRNGSAVEQEEEILSSYARTFQKAVSTLSSDAKTAAIFVADRTGKICSFGSASTMTLSDFFTVSLTFRAN